MVQLEQTHERPVGNGDEKKDLDAEQADPANGQSSIGMKMNTGQQNKLNRKAGRLEEYDAKLEQKFSKNRDRIIQKKKKKTDQIIISPTTSNTFSFMSALVELKQNSHSLRIDLY